MKQYYKVTQTSTRLVESRWDFPLSEFPLIKEILKKYKKVTIELKQISIADYKLMFG